MNPEKTTPGTPFEPERAKQAILFVCDRMSGSSGFGETMLYKVLFYADQKAYRERGKTISGLTYVRERHGPIPSQPQFKPLVSQMVKAGWVEPRTRKVSKNTEQKRLVPQVDITKHVDSLSKEDILILGEFVQRFWYHTAKGVSNKSHEELAWKLAPMKAELPEFTFLLSKAKLSRADVAWAKEIFEQRRVKS